MSRVSQIKKHRYYWRGVNSLGEKIRGQIDATSIANVKIELHKQGIINPKIVKKYSFFIKKIAPNDLAIFYRQMATLLKAGIPLIQSFEIIIKSQTNLSLKTTIEDIKKNVENGLTFAEALAKYPALFNELTCNLIALGEKTGQLAIMFENVANYKEKIELTKRKLKKAMLYPYVILFAACLVTVLFLTFVVPQFEILFTGFGAELPFLTRQIINLSNLCRAHWDLMLSISCSLSYLLYRIKRHFLGLTELMDKLFLKLPILGEIFAKAIIARFARTLAISFSAGLSLNHALAAARSVTRNRLYINAIDQIKETVYEGQPMHLAMKNTLVFPNLVMQMVAIGEESGSLASMLMQVADFYERDIHDLVDNLSRLLEPIIMAILGLIIGILIIAMYLPLFKLGSVI